MDGVPHVLVQRRAGWLFGGFLTRHGRWRWNVDLVGDDRFFLLASRETVNRESETEHEKEAGAAEDSYQPAHVDGALALF